MKLTIERARQKLALLEAKYNNDPLLKSFYGGRVGFRKQTKRYLQSIDKGIEDAIYMGKLQTFITRHETLLLLPVTPSVQAKPIQKPRQKRSLKEQYSLNSGYMGGGGLTVWNSSKEVRGDYESIAHINQAGNKITWHRLNLPAFVIVEVEQMGQQQADKHFKQETEDRETERQYVNFMLSQGYSLQQITVRYGPY